MGYSLGIDFGTSATKISLKQDNLQPFSLPIGNNYELSMPSVIAYKRIQGNKALKFAVGEDADSLHDFNPDDFKVLRDIKRFLEIKEHPPKDFPFQKYLWWDEKSRNIKIWESTFEVEDVIQEIINEALKRAQRRVIERDLIPPLKINKQSSESLMSSNVLQKAKTETDEALLINGWPMKLACSVTSGLEIRRTLQTIASKLGFVDFKIENIQEEPILAALPYLNSELNVGDIIVVYDFGGGTFDTAVVMIDSLTIDGKPSITVLSAGGLPFCGGTDIDDAFTEYLIKQIATKLGKTDPIQIPDDIKDKLKNQARGMKEDLSVRETSTIVTSTNFPYAPAFSITVTRPEFETFLQDMPLPDNTKIIQKTMDCVIAAWQKARMVYRNTDEVSGAFYLKINRKTGETSKYIIRLGFKDLRANAKHVLLIGGTTSIPLIKSKLFSALKGIHFISDSNPYKPVVACSMGAASQIEHIETIIDRLPFSISLKQGEKMQEFYKAFSPIVNYQMYSLDTKIPPYRSTPCLVKDDDNKVSLECIAPDGETMSSQHFESIAPGEYTLEITRYGQITLVDSSTYVRVEFPNPKPHRLLQERLQGIIDEKEQRDREEAERAAAQLGNQDYHTDGGG